MLLFFLILLLVVGYLFSLVCWNAGETDGFANAGFSGFFLAKSQRRKNKEPQKGNADQPNGGQVTLMASQTLV